MILFKKILVAYNFPDICKIKISAELLRPDLEEMWRSVGQKKQQKQNMTQMNSAQNCLAGNAYYVRCG